MFKVEMWFYMNIIVKMCDELGTPDNGADSIKKVRNKLNEYICQDYDKLLYLNAELKMNENFPEDTNSAINRVMSICTLGLTVANIFGGKTAALVGIFVWLVMIALILPVCRAYSKNSKREIWKNYMRVVLDELEKNFEKTNSDTNQGKSIRPHRVIKDKNRKDVSYGNQKSANKRYYKGRTHTYSAGRLEPVRRSM